MYNDVVIKYVISQETILLNWCGTSIMQFDADNYAIMTTVLCLKICGK